MILKWLFLTEKFHKQSNCLIQLIVMCEVCLRNNGTDEADENPMTTNVWQCGILKCIKNSTSIPKFDPMGLLHSHSTMDLNVEQRGAIKVCLKMPSKQLIWSRKTVPHSRGSLKDRKWWTGGQVRKTFNIRNKEMAGWVDVAVHADRRMTMREAGDYLSISIGQWIPRLSRFLSSISAAIQPRLTLFGPSPVLRWAIFTDLGDCWFARKLR